MFFGLLFGMLIGAGVVVFSMQNTALVTLTLFSHQTTAPLAFVIIASVAAGIAIALFIMLPYFIQNALNAYAERRERRHARTAAQPEATPTEHSPANS